MFSYENQSMCDDGKEIASMVLEGLNTYSDVFDEHIAKNNVVQVYVRSL